MKTKSPFQKYTGFLALFIAFTGASFAQEVQWMTFAEAAERTATDANPKKVFIDVYTDWCGWCKKMDQDTFQNPDVARYMEENFYMVKMDGEGKDPITFKGKTYSFVPSGRKGYHELAAALMQGRLSYPTTIFLDEEMNMLSPVPGYQKPEPFMQIAKYFGENIYKEKDWKTYAGAK
jgi:thioredoxin-related protein